MRAQNFQPNALKRLRAFAPTSGRIRQRVAASRSFNKSSYSAPNLFRNACRRRYKLGWEPREKTEKILANQELPGAMLARSDPDGWNADCICDLSRNIRDHDLQQHGERAG